MRFLACSLNCFSLTNSVTHFHNLVPPRSMQSQCMWPSGALDSLQDRAVLPLSGVRTLRTISQNLENMLLQLSQL